MNITIRINTGNAAFEDDPRYETARILKTAAERVAERGLMKGDTLNLRDINGNTVGTLKVTR